MDINFKTLVRLMMGCSNDELERVAETAEVLIKLRKVQAIFKEEQLLSILED